jgi:hypothetical protein
MLGLQALESGSPGMSTSRPRTQKGLRTLMRRIPQPQAWEDGSDLKPLASSPRACGLGVSRKAHSPSFRVQPTRMRAWGMILRGRGVGTGPTHAHAGLGHGFLEDATRKPSSPRACGLGEKKEVGVTLEAVQPTRVRAWTLAGKGEIENRTVIMLGLQALESGSPGMSTSRPRTFQGLRTLMRRIPQPQVWEDRSDHKPLVSSPCACGLGESGRRFAPAQSVQPTRMRAWGRITRAGDEPHVQPIRMRAWGCAPKNRPAAPRPAHAHAGLG